MEQSVIVQPIKSTKLVVKEEAKLDVKNSKLKDKPPAVPSYSCKFCSKFCATQNELKEHELSHTANKELQCPDCGVGFSRRSYLSEHQCIHNGEKPHGCYYCGKSFTLRCNLVRHVRIHTGEKPFECDVCKLTFILKKNMLEHRRIHTGEKPFKCDHCDFMFARRSSLVRHARIHTGEKKYECQECGKFFSWKYYLRRHVNTHVKKWDGVKRKKRVSKKRSVASAKTIQTEAIDLSIGKANRRCSAVKDELMGDHSNTMEGILTYNDHSYAVEETCELGVINEIKEEIEEDPIDTNLQQNGEEPVNSSHIMVSEEGHVTRKVTVLLSSVEMTTSSAGSTMPAVPLDYSGRGELNEVSEEGHITRKFTVLLPSIELTSSVVGSTIPAYGLDRAGHRELNELGQIARTRNISDAQVLNTQPFEIRLHRVGDSPSPSELHEE